MKDRVKVKFPVENGSSETEIMFALPVEENRYILDNSPFYTFGISFCDEFLASEIGGELVFSKIISRGGHSTYRVKLPATKDHSYFLLHWTNLEKLGCTFEGSSANERRLYSIDMASHVDVIEAYKILECFEEQGVWEFEEGYYFNQKTTSVN